MTLCTLAVRQATVRDAAAVASVLQEAARWLAEGGRALWPPASISDERVLRDVAAGLFFVACDGDELAGVTKFELEDAYFWPEIERGSSAFVHKLAVRRQWAGQGVSTALLAFARQRTASLRRENLRLDCVADRAPLRRFYEGFGFELHSIVQRSEAHFARYALRVGATPQSTRG